MASVDTGEAVAALGDAYQGIGALAGGLSEADFLQPSRCRGWTVTDVLYHLLGDARRGLAALATPAETEPDVDFVSYWASWPPGGDDDLVRARALRAAAATVTVIGGSPGLVEAWREAAPAAVRLAGRRWPQPTGPAWATWLTGSRCSADPHVRAGQDTA
jgi:Mycothiol maleylpyruvate isomerase N-terminal domain